MSLTSQVEKWVDEVAELTEPAKVAWADGSKAEYERLIADMLRDGTLLPLNSRTYPNCYLHRSHPTDVARTEQLTFICTRSREEAGPTNNWMAPAEGKEKLRAALPRQHARPPDVGDPVPDGPGRLVHEPGRSDGHG